MDQGPFEGWRFVGDAVGLSQETFGVGEMCIGIVVNGAQRLTCANRVANLLVQDQTYGGIDHLVLFLTATTEYQARDANLFTLNSGNESTRRAQKRRLVLCLGQPLGIIDHPWVASLLGYDLAEFLKRGSIADEFRG